MSDDLVARLRDWAAYPEGRNPAKAPCTEAADEIERLRTSLKEMQVLLGAIDAALDQTLREALGLSFHGKVT